MTTRSLIATAALLALGTGAASAQVPPRLDAHFLNADQEFFVAEQEYEGGYIYVTLGTMVTPASDQTRGEAQFVSLGGHKPAGERFWSRWYWKTRAATTQDIAVGLLAFCLDATDPQGVYRAPGSRNEAVSTAWFLATIVDVSDLFRQRVLFDQYTAGTQGLRVPLTGGGEVLRTPPAQLDAQSIDTSEFFVADNEFTGSGYEYVTLARMVTAPTSTSNGEAQFLSLSGGNHRTGTRFWSRYFWQTRVAQPAELTVGKAVFAFDATGPDGTYRAPQNRREAVTTRWFLATVTDVAEAYRQRLQVAGSYNVVLTGLRVGR